MKCQTALEVLGVKKVNQEKLDKLGKTIYFINHYGNLSVKELLRKALLMAPTQTTTCKTKQILGQRRSLEDLYLIVKHYCPEITIQEIVKDLKTIPTSSMFCYSFNRQMFCFQVSGKMSQSSINYFQQLEL